jgi:hypothetical protein
MSHLPVCSELVVDAEQVLDEAESVERNAVVNFLVEGFGSHDKIAFRTELRHLNLLSGSCEPK